MEEGSKQISVIVPTLNEQQSIRTTIQLIRGRVEKSDTVLDVTVVDGGSKDNTVVEAMKEKVRVVNSERGRGHQLNAGAAASTGEYLLFLHADTKPPYGFDRHVRSTLADRNVSLGAFRLSIESQLFGIRVVQFFANLRARFGNLPYGDQGFFLRRTVFNSLGGFPRMELMEDFQMARNAQKIGRVVVSPAMMVTSGRRWEKYGVIRTTLLNQFIVTAYLLGVPVSTLNRWYRGPKKGN